MPRTSCIERPLLGTPSSFFRTRVVHRENLQAAQTRSSLPSFCAQCDCTKSSTKSKANHCQNGIFQPASTGSASLSPAFHCLAHPQTFGHGMYGGQQIVHLLGTRNQTHLAGLFTLVSHSAGSGPSGIGIGGRGMT